jgi:hypothetical protein
MRASSDIGSSSSIIQISVSVFLVQCVNFLNIFEKRRKKHNQAKKKTLIMVYGLEQGSVPFLM